MSVDDNKGAYMEGQGDLISRLIIGITRVTIRIIGFFLTYLLSPPDPPSTSGDSKGNTLTHGHIPGQIGTRQALLNYNLTAMWVVVKIMVPFWEP